MEEPPRVAVDLDILALEPGDQALEQRVRLLGEPEEVAVRDHVGLERSQRLLEAAGLSKAILVDCSHDNSAKQPERQPAVLRDVLAQITAGNTSIMGAMIESNLGVGSQPFPQPPERLRYGVSITDPCIDWPTTEAAIREVHAALDSRFHSLH